MFFIFPICFILSSVKNIEKHNYLICNIITRINDIIKVSIYDTEIIEVKEGLYLYDLNSKLG